MICDNREHSSEPLNVPFTPFSRSLLHTFTLRQKFEYLIILGVTLGYRHAISKGILQLDYPHREHLFEPFDIPFTPFSRSLLHSFTLGLNFEPLTILQVTLSYSYAIAKQIPPLDSPHLEHSFEALNVPFALFSRSLLHTFTHWRNFEPLTISAGYLRL